MIWNKTYGGPNSDLGFCIINAPDGGYVVSGTTSSFGSGKSDIWFLKTNSKGALQWNQTLGGADFDEGQSVYVNPSGVYTIVGITTSFGNGNGSSDGWLIETNVFDQTTPIASVEWSVLQQASIAGIVVLMLVGVAAVLLLAIKKSKRAV